MKWVSVDPSFSQWVEAARDPVVFPAVVILGAILATWALASWLSRW